MNIVILSGRLVADPEKKYTQSGKAFTRFTIAVTRQFNRQEADFVSCVAWEKRAELVDEYFKKGNLIGIQGRLNVRSYDDDQGQKRKITEVVVDGVEFLESKKSASTGSTSSAAPTNNATEIADTDFPF